MEPVSSTNSYPGENASAFAIVQLGNAYYNAAMELFKHASAPDPLSFAPARLCAIHAIELYLNAVLRHEGVAPSQIRGRMHNLADPTFFTRLKLRKKTADHLQALTERREYLIARYAPEQASQHTELNRLTATLVEVMMKAGHYVSNP
ncbi:hypothetical protein [Shinella zoogloeoides]|uniref:hypothetical protein n=1 Tax=Shinella zoogloeoides TaxID=352475 RepID=UPI00273D375C|nr:hypothetical protein [Shinella zoogloeoides]WLR93889.1 hypothetical protein Q9316_06795 [Shinella zoogloeoides]